jgi:hypothetical protein
MSIIGNVPFSKIRGFMIKFNQIYGTDFSDDNIKTFIPIYKKEKEEEDKTQSPQRSSATLDYKTYLKLKLDPEIDIYKKMREYTGLVLANALNDVGIDPEGLVGDTNFSKHKDKLTATLLQSYVNRDKTRADEPQDDSEEEKPTDEPQDDSEEESNAEPEYVSVLKKEPSNESDDDYHSTNEKVDEEEEKELTEEEIEEIRETFKSNTIIELKNFCKIRSIELPKKINKDAIIDLLVEYDVNH